MDHLHTSHRLLMLLLFLFFSRGVFIQFFFHSHSRARGEANRRAEVFGGDLRLHAPPLFLGILVLIQQCSYGRQSCHGGDQRNRPRIAAAPYQPASAAVPRIMLVLILGTAALVGWYGAAAIRGLFL